MLFEHFCYPHGVNGNSSVPDYGPGTLYGWGADGIAETFAQAGNGSDFEQAVGYICDPMGNVACHVYYNDPTNLDYAFYDAFGLLTGYVATSGGLPSVSLWYKGQSGAETQWFAGTNFGHMGPSDPLSYFPGLILMGYRWYNPSIGRFWTRDPQGYDGGINLYAFCRNNPVNHSDPLGLDGLDDKAAQAFRA